MSTELRRTKLVQQCLEALVAAGKNEFRPGDVCNLLREKNEPMGTWEVRGEFSKLETAGVLQVDDATGIWRLRNDGEACSAG